MTISKPLLAYTVPTNEDEDAIRKLSFPLMWSPKLDGIRTLIVAEKGGPVTRTFKAIPNDKVRAFLSRPELYGFDGECVFGPVTDKDVFNRTQSAVMKIAGPGFDEADGKLLVFDDFTDPDLPFEQRFMNLSNRVLALPDDLKPYIVIVPHSYVHNALDLENVERIVVQKAYEGVMVRSPAGKYKCGRSTPRDAILGKIKRFRDTEAVIIGFEELMHNDNEAGVDNFGRTKRASLQENLRPGGTLGALIMKSDEFTESFKIGTGFDAAMKQDIWNRRDELMGALVTFKYQESGMKELPRFPVFKAFRKD